MVFLVSMVYNMYMLTFIKETGFRQVPSGNKRKIGLFKCDCGNTKELNISDVKRGVTKSCGCINKMHIKKLGDRKGKEKASYKHGLFGTQFYKKYFSIVSRTKDNPNNPSTRFYGMRGIKNEWKSFDDFKNDMYESYLEHSAIHGERQTTIDRINPKGNYSKKNCRWATYKEQGANRSNNVLITINGKTKHLEEWSRVFNIDPITVKKRYLKKEVKIEKGKTRRNQSSNKTSPQT